MKSSPFFISLSPRSLTTVNQISFVQSTSPAPNLGFFNFGSMDDQNVADIVEGYYEYLENNEQHLLMTLYKEGSTMTRIDNGVVVEEASTVEDIGAIIMALEFSEFDYICHYWESWNDGVLVVVIGSLRQAGFIRRRKFSQILMVAPYLDNTFFICNDVFSFTGVEFESSDEIDHNYDPSSPGSVAESDVTSQQVPMESDNLLQSGLPNNADVPDESAASAEIHSSTGLTLPANDIRSQPALKVSDIALDVKDASLDQQESNPEHVKELLTDTEDTDIESLIPLDEMQIEPRSKESDKTTVQ